MSRQDPNGMFPAVGYALQQLRNSLFYDLGEHHYKGRDVSRLRGLISELSLLEDKIEVLRTKVKMEYKRLSKDDMVK